MPVPKRMFGSHIRRVFQLILALVFCLIGQWNCWADQPNVIVIMTDDQGYGDFGFTGNKDIATPNIDRLANESAWFDRFYVSPVCSPTRACLLTGRYNYRTRVVDTYVGRSMMDPDEVTIAEYLRHAGYRTGIFGKWHLGDNYPLRPTDQGFDVSVVHRGGGIGQNSDPIGAEAKYTNPTLLVNGVSRSFEGYCSDIYYQEAMTFISSAVREQKPFFAYIPDNCPHGPFRDVPADWFSKYQGVKLSNIAENAQKVHQQIYSMISNIDENIGILRKHLERLGVADNTIVVFLTDNGPNRKRFNAGFRGIKSSVYEGGIRTPLLFHWPNRIKKPVKVTTAHAHIDLLPTLLEACQVDSERPVDGRSFLSATLDPNHSFDSRTLFIQTHRGNTPQRYHHFAAIGERWKLVHPSGFGRMKLPGPPKFELYDLSTDHSESTNLAAKHPEIVARLKREYDRWFDDVSTERTDNFAPPSIVIKSDPATHVLTRQDLRAPNGKRPFHQDSTWQLTIPEDIRCNVRMIFKGNQVGQTATLDLGGRKISVPYQFDQKSATVKSIRLPKGDLQLSSFLDLANNERHLVHQVVIEVLK